MSSVQVKPKTLRRAYNVDQPGYAVIVLVESYTSNKKARRNNAAKNIIDLAKVLPKFGYEINEIIHDPTGDDLQNAANAWQLQNFENYSSFLLIVSSHGDRDGIIASNGSKFMYKDFEQKIMEIGTLKKKPKWLMFSCCHGSDRNLAEPSSGGLSAVNMECEEDDDICDADIDSNQLPFYSDLLVTYASVVGYKSYRMLEGTWLLKALTDCMSDFYDKHVKRDERAIAGYDILELHADMTCMLAKVKARVEVKCNNSKEKKYVNVKQLPEYVSRLRKKFVLQVSGTSGTIGKGALDVLKRLNIFPSNMISPGVLTTTEIMTFQSHGEEPNTSVAVKTADYVQIEIDDEYLDSDDDIPEAEALN